MTFHHRVTRSTTIEEFVAIMRREIEAREQLIIALVTYLHEPRKRGEWRAGSKKTGRPRTRTDAEVRLVVQLAGTGRTHRQIAVHLNMPVATVGNLLKRARREAAQAQSTAASETTEKEPLQ